MFLVYAFISECFPLTAPENQVLYRGLCSLWIVFYAGWEICILFNCYTCRHLFSLAIFIKEVCLSCMCFWPPHQYMNVCTYVSLYQNWTICLFYAYTILLCFFVALRSRIVIPPALTFYLGLIDYITRLDSTWILGLFVLVQKECCWTITINFSNYAGYCQWYIHFHNINLVNPWYFKAFLASSLYCRSFCLLGEVNYLTGRRVVSKAFVNLIGTGFFFLLDLFLDQFLISI